MGLVQVATNTVTSAVASVTLTGIDSDDVYMLTISGAVPTVASDGKIRVTKGGTAQSDSQYDWAYKGLRTDTTFNNLANQNQTDINLVAGWSTVTTSSVGGNAIVYLYNFNSSSEYSFLTSETVTMWSGGTLGSQGGGVHTVASASDGIQFFFNNNIASGTFTLYRVV